jgi:hypothetical protein
MIFIYSGEVKWFNRVGGYDQRYYVWEQGDKEENEVWEELCRNIIINDCVCTSLNLYSVFQYRMSFGPHFNPSKPFSGDLIDFGMHAERLFFSPHG